MSFEQFPLPVPQWRDLSRSSSSRSVIYRLLLVLVGTRALQIVFGLLVLAAIYFAALLLKLTMITYLLGVVFTYGVIAALVVFQPELRHALARLGQTRVFRLFGGQGGPRWRRDRQGDGTPESQRHRRDHSGGAGGSSGRIPRHRDPG